MLQFIPTQMSNKFPVYKTQQQQSLAGSTLHNYRGEQGPILLPPHDIIFSIVCEKERENTSFLDQMSDNRSRRKTCDETCISLLETLSEKKRNQVKNIRYIFFSQGRNFVTHTHNHTFSDTESPVQLILLPSPPPPDQGLFWPGSMFQIGNRS